MGNSTKIYTFSNMDGLVYMLQENCTYASITQDYFDKLGADGLRTLHKLASKSAFLSTRHEDHMGPSTLYAEVYAEGAVVRVEDMWFGMTEGDMVDELAEHKAQRTSFTEAAAILREHYRSEYDYDDAASIREEYHNTFGDEV